MSTENVSWSKPLGDSFAGQVGGKAQEINKQIVQNTMGILNPKNYEGISTNKPVGGDVGQALYGNPNAPLTTKGVDKKTGEQLDFNQDAPPGAGFGIPVSRPKSQVGGMSDVIQLTPQSPRSALALEERLRSEARKKLNPNVEYAFNLEANPIANRAVVK